MENDMRDELQPVDKNQGPLTLDSLLKQIDELQLEKKEFGLQRAKMKGFLLQKEEELKNMTNISTELKRLQDALDESQSQLTVTKLEMEGRFEEQTRKYNEEISSLDKVLAETLEESRRRENETKTYKTMSEKLENELKNCRNQMLIGQQGNSILGESTQQQILNVPGTVLSAIARKMTNLASSAESDDYRKSQDDDDNVYKALVDPLKEEVEALKEKIREMDTDISYYKTKLIESKDNVIEQKLTANNSQEESSNSSATSDFVFLNTSVDNNVAKCEQCALYKIRVEEMQDKLNDADKRLLAMDKLKDEHDKETIYRKQMEEKWNEKLEEHKNKVQELKNFSDQSHEVLSDVKLQYEQTVIDFQKELKLCTENGAKMKQHILKLEEENHNLKEKHMKFSVQLQNEEINLPSSVAELHEYLLKRNEELIAMSIVKESIEEEINRIKNSAAIFESQIQGLNSTVSLLEKQLLDERSRFSEQIKNTNQCENELISCRAQLDTIFKRKTELESIVMEQRNKIMALQNDLTNSEEVQRDFVRLSQSLQQELERIRESGTSVRWEHEEDISDCHDCGTVFSDSKTRKDHCRHCGRIFCASCLSRAVKSGPNMRNSHVCRVCHTLLVRDSAPYFSTEPPHQSN
ncbi:FYVE zinc finger,Zinc finger, FYVE-related,Zinc finger, FYVE/PHD-type,Zinc finger, RING/FYVE/PHD- [Cinara cedri]|uniref:FYVE zinc finger,Zinc finger, FYVE-related,Zinc finger, FYVE/PHD-type,Zinc finger, RING/FYVE/PHD n=1 Tax=Cinara cedri TaxID=506608 RepID=A0A5E4N6P6_9HEMI|nr:FYVE zinc finger,Zinc finger, FYVE-related,Zinc finger, FYVE/PHD-type,Zinc finger, RING/FYVE/PHD- [Cinara cedri]